MFMFAVNLSEFWIVSQMKDPVPGAVKFIGMPGGVDVQALALLVAQLGHPGAGATRQAARARGLPSALHCRSLREQHSDFALCAVALEGCLDAAMQLLRTRYLREFTILNLNQKAQKSKQPCNICETIFCLGLAPSWRGLRP